MINILSLVDLVLIILRLIIIKSLFVKDEAYDVLSTFLEITDLWKHLACLATHSRKSSLLIVITLD